ncbi:uncharacterized protein MKZ38_009326 [Zalerion maritima]|uniref:Uncharacterized protein n=1 Tax=Zalerion maritima TaxID=339359 RepID=A0AAD5WMC3_9PEZI|nr:uncharacterized protein MKZ38_009326 [Zalerion maritima]
MDGDDEPLGHPRQTQIQLNLPEPFISSWCSHLADIPYATSSSTPSRPHDAAFHRHCRASSELISELPRPGPADRAARASPDTITRCKTPRPPRRSAGDKLDACWGHVLGGEQYPDDPGRPRRVVASSHKGGASGGRIHFFIRYGKTIYYVKVLLAAV